MEEETFTITDDKKAFIEELANTENNAIAQRYLTKGEAALSDKEKKYLYAATLPRNNKKTLKEAFVILQKIAKENLSDAQYLLSVFYEKGWGVKANSFKTAHWLNEAAKNGSSYAIFKKSQADIKSAKTEKEFKTIFQQLKNLYETVKLPALKYCLSALYYTGKGGEQDLDLSFRLAQEAYKEGCKESSLLLADFYLIGYPAERNMEEAEKLLKEGMHYEKEYAMLNLARIYMDKDYITPERKKLARAYLETLQVSTSKDMEEEACEDMYKYFKE